MPALALTLYFTYSRGGLLAARGRRSSACSPSPETGSGCWRRWRSPPRRPAGGARVPAHHSLANNVASQTSVDQGVTVLLVLVGRHAALARALRAPAAAGGRAAASTGRAVELSRDPRCSRGSPSSSAVVALPRAVPSAAGPGTSSPAPTSKFPEIPPSTSRTSPAPAGTTSGGSRSTPSRKSRWLGHGAGTYVFSWDKLRSIDLAVLDAHSLYLEAFAELGLVGGLLVLGPDRRAALVRLSRLARGTVPAPRGLRGAVHGDADLRGRGRLRLVLGDRRPGRGLLPRSRRAGRGPLRADRADPRARGRRAQPLRGRGRRRRARLARGDRPDRPAAGRARDRAPASARSPPATSAAPSTTPKPPARSSPGPPRPTCSSA